jgi:hypothetical protein
MTFGIEVELVVDFLWSSLSKVVVVVRSKQKTGREVNTAERETLGVLR